LKNIYLYLIKVLLLHITIQAQTQYTFEGNVYDSITKNALKDVNIYIHELHKGIATNSSGYFAFSLPKNKTYTITASHLGYKNYNKTILLNSDQYITISLSSLSYTTKEIEIKANKGNTNITSTKTGEKKLTTKKIKNLPVFMGEIDPLKTIQLLPGIQSAGTSMGGGLNIRGGSPGQNMILLDNANIFNPYHLMGFFSVFNGDAIEHINLIKSGIPAEYGGRLSSILEIKSKTGDFSHHNVNGGIGFISSKLTIDGPVIQNKASFCISGRRTYLDLLKPIAEDLIDHSSLISIATDYFFYDLSGKLSVILSPKDYMYLTVYNGNDRYVNSLSSNNTSISWGNSIASMQWKHIWNNKNAYDHNVSWSNYRFNFLTSQQNYFLSFNSGAEDFCYQANLNIIQIPDHKIKTGAGISFHNFSPTRINSEIFDLSLNFDQKTNIYSYEAFIYAGDDIQWSDKIKTNTGIRYTFYEHIGPYKEIIKDEQGIPQDTNYFKDFESISRYDHIEPRITIRYQLNTMASIKASYTKNFQFIHLGSLPSVSLPTDVWVPSSHNLKPQSGDQYSLGYFRNFNNNMFESYIQIYYKQMNHQIEFKKGVLNSAFEQNFYGNIAKGRGYAYGTEFYTEKTKGHITGWVSYTLSRTIKKFKEINNGNPFPAKHDRIHDFSIVAKYQPDNKWTFSCNFIFCTGEAVTLPTYRYLIDGFIINEFTKRNAYRMKNYHRLDISITYILKKNAKFNSSLTCSIYNVYNRKNPFYLFYQVSQDFMNVDIEQVSLFPVLPSLTWNFKF